MDTPSLCHTTCLSVSPLSILKRFRTCWKMSESSSNRQPSTKWNTLTVPHSILAEKPLILFLSAVYFPMPPFFSLSDQQIWYTTSVLCKWVSP